MLPFLLGRVNDGGDDVDEKRSPLGVQGIVAKLSQVLPECSSHTSDFEHPPHVDTHRVDPEHGAVDFIWVVMI